MNPPVLPNLCITATGKTPAELLESAECALASSPFVELRLDWLPQPADALSGIQQLASMSSPRKGRRPVLQATCRRKTAGGRFTGSVTAQLNLLERAARAGCSLVDLEIETAEGCGPEAVSGLRQFAALILSFHDFERTGAILQAARRLLRFPADYYKLVTTATRQSDNCTVLEFLQAPKSRSGVGKWVAFCMGEVGIPSRVLALSRGSAFIYAAPPPSRVGQRVSREPAAPGQLDLETLRGLYRVEEITETTALYGLVGDPVRQSIGPAIHSAAFRASDLDARYLPLLTKNLRDLLAAARRYPLAGFSVTIPHKERIMRWMDRVDARARAVGAVNTVRRRAGRWEATNTDVEGISQPLRQVLRLPSRRPVLPQDFRALIIGNGGAARAAAVALRQLRCRHLAVTGRNPARLRRFARAFGARSISWSVLSAERFDLLIHATPVGMWPRADVSPLRPEQINAEIVFDLVYNPPRTQLLRLAQRRGARTISGLAMFLTQAALQFQFWTRQPAPEALMRRVALRELRRLAHNTAEWPGSLNTP